MVRLPKGLQILCVKNPSIL
jgi:hypothetical protein